MAAVALLLLPAITPPPPPLLLLLPMPTPPSSALAAATSRLPPKCTAERTMLSLREEGGLLGGCGPPSWLRGHPCSVHGPGRRSARPLVSSRRWCDAVFLLLPDQTHVPVQAGSCAAWQGCMCSLSVSATAGEL